MNVRRYVKSKTRAKLTALIFIGALASAVSYSAFAETYDVVINNGGVMDPETNFDGVRNVGGKAGRIASITENSISGKELIDRSM